MGVHGRASLTVVVVAALLGACTGGSGLEAAPSSEAASAVPPSVTEPSLSASASEEVIDHSAVLVEWLAAPDFSARFVVSGFDEQPGGRSVRSGAGAVAGDDSQVWVVDDLSGWDGAYFLGDGAFLVGGPGAATVRARAAKVVDGVLYTKDHRGHWHETDTSDPATQPGHVFETLRGVEAFDVAGTETVDGVEYTVMRPSDPVEYDPTRLSMPAGLSDFIVDTTVLVDDAGVPVRIALQVDATDHDYTLGVDYDLVDVGEAITVAPPDEIWVPAADAGFTTSEILERDPIAFEVPASWEPTGNDDGVLFTQAPNGSAVFASQVVEEANLEEGLEVISGANGIVIDDVVQTDLHGLPSLLGTGTSPSGFGMAFSQALGSNLVLIAAWAGPDWDAHVQMATFTEVLHTIELRNPAPGPLPGNTQGDPELQTDALTPVVAAAVVAAGDGCEMADVDVMWTDVTGARWPEWTEAWHVDACGDLQVHELTFTGTADGGTDISLSSAPFRYAEATSPRPPGDPAEDPALAASLLDDQPWLIDADLDINEVAIATAVQASQFHGSGLHVVILESSLGDRLEDYFDELFARLGAGTLLLIDADSLIAESHEDEYIDAVSGAVEAAAETGTTNETIVEEFVLQLAPEVQGLD